MTPVCNSVRYGFTNERNSEGRNSVFVRNNSNSVREPVRGELYSFIVRGELWFAANYSSRGANLFAVANCFAIFQKMFGELVRQNLRSPRTGPPRTTFAANDRQIFSRERIFWRTVRQFAAEYGRTRSNLGELRRTPPNVRRTPANVRRSSAGCRCWRTVGEFARSSPEFARVRASSPEFAANDSSPGILPTYRIAQHGVFN